MLEAPQVVLMATNANTVPEPLPREMQQHTYAIMRRVEESHWWFVGRRQIIKSFLERVVRQLRTNRENLKILDVGCGSGANLELLAAFGEAEGGDVLSDALSFCRER